MHLLEFREFPTNLQIYRETRNILFREIPGILGTRHWTLILVRKKKTQKYQTAQTALVSMQNSHTHLGREWAQPVCEWTPSQTINLCVVANDVKGSIRVYEARPRVCHKTIGFIQRLRGAQVRRGNFCLPLCVTFSSTAFVVLIKKKQMRDIS